MPGSLEAIRVLEVAGILDHPAVTRWMASAGRMMAGTPGDATTIGKTKGKPMDSINFDEKTETMMTEASVARSRGESAKAARIQRQIDALFTRQYGTEPVIGTSGGPTS